ncbi:hypothetical protein Taro_037775 [Colocasia esculenta]|uniref:Uncharacterized protein n=1 Tax=Colocasia esculenta TaxID=4460 RepID=A0A843WQQ2_COLES|nr:hypothetical protein [Colocasia esculenta]
MHYHNLKELKGSFPTSRRT